MRGFANPKFVVGELLAAMLTAVFSLGVALAALRVSPTSLGLRWKTGGADQVLHYEIFASAEHTFPFLPNDRLGFPEAQNLFFAPLFDLWSAVVVWGTAAVVPDGFWALNLYNLGSFLSVGLTSYVFFRALKLRRITAVVFGVLFATVPFHFAQLTMGHPFLSNYWAVPLIGILALMTAGEPTDPFAGWVGRASSARLRLARRLVPIVVLAPAVAFTQSYYFVFAVLIVGGVWVVRVIAAGLRRDRVRELAWPTVTMGALVVLVGAELAVLSLNLGDRYEKYFGSRSFAESEAYGGKMIDLLLPSRLSGIAPLAHRAEFYQATTGILRTSESAFTAVVAAVAIVLCFSLLLVRLTGASNSVLSDPRIGVLLAGFLIAFLFFITSGLGTVLAFFVSPEIRGWSRMSIVVSMFALGVLATVLERLLRRRRLFLGALLTISAVAILDQVPRVASVVPIDAVTDVALRQFTSNLEAHAAADCGIVVLPLKGFPETGPIGGMGDYDEALPYIAGGSGGDLRWSYGAVDGTHSGDFWQGVSTPTEFASALGGTDACSIVVDTAAYAPGPPGAAAPAPWQPWIEAAGQDPDHPSLTSDDRYLVFDLST
ncbi:hypothetical protein [Subtercola boreus]|uniref:Glycosyltransferase RgtA/B/C/D-like domain-containing protein n=1 Tax=Subtercola boreus TaxID=120213 RepID=A0A3E0WF26_9MICO|nr:hypothetical protein [Subtercola boreus]RFA22628.1 hypothetical protein B7R24_03160 [Subtercola boreus]RFA22984.1 hypothetical protein B7R23_03155 [Subtercola boreus]RFA28735.1 hypothetical protein B7R25_03170 [Subtercola boreus]